MSTEGKLDWIWETSAWILFASSKMRDILAIVFSAPDVGDLEGVFFFSVRTEFLFR